MKLEDVLQRFTKPKLLANALGVTPQAIYNWKRAGKIPQLQQMKIEALTYGELVAGEFKSQKTPSRTLTVRLSQQQYDKARVIDQANMANGIRIALDAYPTADAANTISSGVF